MSAATVLTVAQVAEALQVSRWTIYDRIRRGEIPTVVVGRSKRIPRIWLDELGALDPNSRTESASTNEVTLMDRLDRIEARCERIEALIFRTYHHTSEGINALRAQLEQIADAGA